MGLAEPLPANELFPHVQITRKQLVPCLGNLDDFLKRYQPMFYSNAPKEASLERLVHAASRRHAVEECFERAKGEAGLAQYEVRSWVGWHHHMTLSMLATWFLTLEARRVEGKNTGRVGATDGGRVPIAAA